MRFWSIRKKKFMFHFFGRKCFVTFWIIKRTTIRNLYFLIQIKMETNLFFSLFLLSSTFFIGGCEHSSEFHKQTDQTSASSFEECAAAGGNVAESYPRQCFLGEQAFTEVIDEIEVVFEPVVVASETFEIAPFTVKCQGYEPIDQDCYVVNGEYFYDPLENFRFEQGYKVTAKVDKIKMFSDEEYEYMADISQFSYKVTEIISKEESEETEADYFGKNEEESPRGYALVCRNHEGTWIEEHKECEYLSKDNCDSYGGVFEECTSACRHDPEAQMCTLNCVPVCSFANEEEKRQDCVDAGGNWEAVGKMGLPDCIYSYADAGKKCSASSECEGNCIVTEVDGSDPQCAENSDIFGCHSSIEEFEETGAIMCVD